MSIAAQNRVWEFSQQDGTKLIAMLALADWADADGVCWYANDKIAARIRRQERQVTRILSALRDAGEIFAPPNFGAGQKTLKLVTVGLNKPQIIDVLTRRFEMEADAAEASADAILAAQGNEKNPSSATGKKPVIGDGIKAKKPVIGDQKNPSSATKKPVKAMSTDPNTDPNTIDPPINNKQQQPTTKGLVGGRGEVEQILIEAGVENPKRAELLALDFMTPGLAAGHIATAPTLPLAIYRMSNNWEVPEREIGRPKKRWSIPPELEGIIKR